MITLQDGGELNMLDHRTLWRTDFTLVPPVARRVARFALQLVSQDPQVRRDLGNKKVLSALWQLTLPLFNPQVTAAYLATLTDQDQAWLSSEESWRDDLETRHGAAHPGVSVGRE